MSGHGYRLAMSHDWTGPPADIVKQAHGELPGRNFREVDENEVVDRMRQVYAPAAVVYRQVTFNEERLALWAFVQSNGAGWAYACDYWAAYHNIQGRSDVEKKAIRYFYFESICEHKYIETKKPSGNYSGWHEHRCTVCGHEYGYDTSD